MPIDKTKLEQVFAEMRDLFLKDPDTAVTSQGFIKTIQNYCIYELKKLGIKEKIIRKGVGRIIVNKIILAIPLNKLIG